MAVVTNTVYIADGDNHRIQRLALGTGIVTTVAGLGNGSFRGDGGPGTRAFLSFPRGVAVDAGGNVLIADTSNHRIRRVVAGTGVITTVAGGGVFGYIGDGGPATSASLWGPSGVAVDAGGNVYIADTSNNRVRRLATSTGIITTVAGNGSWGFSGDGGPGTSASLRSPSGVAVDAGGNVLIADTSNNRIRRVAAGTGIITTVAGNGSSGFSGDGGPGTSASLRSPYEVAVDGGGNVLIADTSNNRIRRLAAGTGIITTVVGIGADYVSGDGGPGTSASLSYPTGVAVDGGGNLLIADRYNNRIRRLAAGTGVITTVAGNGSRGFSGDGGPATSASLRWPQGVAVDGDGSVLVADTWNCRIRRVAAGTGIITTVAGTGEGGFSGDGGPGTSARLFNPGGVAVDGGGNVFIADSENNRIRRLAAGAGIIATVAGNGTSGFSGDGGRGTSTTLRNPQGVAVDAGGNVYIVDRGNYRIRRLATSTGIITTVAGTGVEGFSSGGGPGTSTMLSNPQGVAVDGLGNLFIADEGGNQVFRLDMRTGIIATVAGNGVYGFSGDGGSGTSASFAFPTGIAVDSNGSVFIAGYDRIRQLVFMRTTSTPLSSITSSCSPTRSTMGGVSSVGSPSNVTSPVGSPSSTSTRSAAATPPSASSSGAVGGSASMSVSAAAAATPLSGSPSLTSSLTRGASPSASPPAEGLSRPSQSAQAAGTTAGGPALAAAIGGGVGGVLVVVAGAAAIVIWARRGVGAAGGGGGSAGAGGGTGAGGAAGTPAAQPKHARTVLPSDGTPPLAPAATAGAATAAATSAVAGVGGEFAAANPMLAAAAMQAQEQGARAPGPAPLAGYA